MRGKEKILSVESLDYISGWADDLTDPDTVVANQIYDPRSPSLHILNPASIVYDVNPGLPAIPGVRDTIPPSARLLIHAIKSSPEDINIASYTYWLKGPGGAWGDRLKAIRQSRDWSDTPHNAEMKVVETDDFDAAHRQLATLAVYRLLLKNGRAFSEEALHMIGSGPLAEMMEIWQPK